jgi:capsular exopolysaccharide synthesis family protein
MPLAFAAVAGLVAAAVSFRLTPIYQATTAVLVRPGQSANQSAYFLTLDQIAKTYAQLMTKRPLLEQVIKEQSLPYAPEDLLKHIIVVPERDTELLDVKVEDRNPVRAAGIANQLVQDFIAQTQAQEQQQISASLQSLQTQASDLEKQITEDARAIAVLQSKTRLTPDEQAQLSNLQQRRSADSATYATVVKNLEDVRGSQLARYESVSVVDSAVVPNKPIRPNKLLNTVLAAVLGLLLALGLIFLIEYLDNTFKSEEDVRRYLGLPMLGRLVLRKNGKNAKNGTSGTAELITLRQPRVAASEAFRELRTNLMFSRVDGPLRTIVVTSAVPGEGKTRTAGNLAVTLAQAGHRCILVDADFRRPSVHRLFRRVDLRGLSNMILADLVLPDLVRSTELPGLRFVCSGTPPPNPSELLGSERMMRITESLLAMTDILVFDTPPLNAVTDAAPLASRADATILVVEAGRTTRQTAAKAKEAIGRVGGKIAGVVLNKVKSGSDTYYYGYHAAEPETPSAEAAGVPAFAGETRRKPVL